MVARIGSLCVTLCCLAFASGVTYPHISEDRIPVWDLAVTETAYAAIRRPPGDGPFPAVVFMHGGLGRISRDELRRNALQQPVLARFLAWGYVAVSATRREIRHDPQDRGVVEDSLALLDAVRKLPYVDPDSVALYGGSGGGTLALEVASVSGALAAIVAGEPATIIYMGMFTKDHIVFGPDGHPTGDRRWDVMNSDPESLYDDGIRQRMRRKLSGLSTPTLILHGDVHPLKAFNLGVFVPEMEALGKPVTVRTYAGEPHGFYWGRGRDPAMALRANRDADAFLRQHVPVQPTAIAPEWATPVVVEPMPQRSRN